MTRTILNFVAGCVVLAGVSSFVGCNGARDTAVSLMDQQGNRGFMTKTVNNAGRERKYGLFVPMSYDSSHKYPVIVFLHGVGEGGSDARSNMRVGLAPFVADNASTFKFICIFPQSPNGQWDEDSNAASDVIAIIHEVAKAYPGADLDRVSLTGLSTGGYGTWAIGATHKDVFAALVPMGSSANPSKFADQLVDMPIQAYHNSGDMFAAAWNDSSMVSKLSSMGGHATYTEYSAMGHDCWETAYGDGAIFSWLEGQRLSARHGSRPAAAAAPVRATSSVTPVSAPAAAAGTNGSKASAPPSTY